MREVAILQNENSVPEVTFNEGHAYPCLRCSPTLGPLEWEILRPYHACKVDMVDLLFPLCGVGWDIPLLYEANAVLVLAVRC